MNYSLADRATTSAATGTAAHLVAPTHVKTQRTQRRAIHTTQPARTRKRPFWKRTRTSRTHVRPIKIWTF